VFTGLTYTGGRSVHLHRDLTSIPVLARAGAIVPMVPRDDLRNGVDLPSVVEVRVYAGADGDFTLVEDRDDERWARTRLTWDDTAQELTVHDVEGDPATLPADRTYRVLVTPATNEIDDRVFDLLDRAQLGYELKATAWRTIRDAANPGAAVLALQSLELSPVLLGALSELLLAR